MRRDKLKKFLSQLKDAGFDSVPASVAGIARANRRAPKPSPHSKASVPDRDKLLEKLKRKYADCKNCPLGGSRLNVVFGEGPASAKLMFIGEGPGFTEDHTGKPFIGRAGALLTKIIEDGMKMKRDGVYITNIVKCHPMKDPSNPEKRGNDRPPSPREVAACMGILREQIRIIRPAVICTLGSPAAKIMLATERGISALRGRVFDVNPLPDEPSYSVKLLPTYHPAYLLRNPEAKVPTWEDIKIVMGLVKKP